MSLAIKIEGVSKQYRLGQVGTGTLTHDLNRWMYKARGKEDPYLKVGEVNDRTQKGDSNYVWALKDIDFEIKKGEMIGIIGGNGAGKSTLLKILSRITQPTTGTMKVSGRIASLLEVGTGFHPELTGRENVYLNGAILGMKKHEITTRFDEIVEFSGIEKYIDTPVKRYSSGMYVRLAFGVAAHLQPEILIVDEVLAVGDSEFQRKSIAKMEQVCKQEGKTLIFVSHNITAIERLCQKCLYLKNGQMVDFDNTEKIIIQYNKDNYEKERLDNNKSPITLENNSKGNRLGPSLGNYKLRIKDVLLYRNEEVEPTVNFQAGDDIRIVLKYENESYVGSNVNQVSFGLPIFNSNEQFVTVLNSKMAYRPFFNAPVEGEVSCEIPKLPLMVGMYRMKVTLNVDGEIAEQLSEGIIISVMESDYYGSGFPNALGRQGVYIDQKWSEIKMMSQE